MRRRARDTGIYSVVDGAGSPPVRFSCVRSARASTRRPPANAATSSSRLAIARTAATTSDGDSFLQGVDSDEYGVSWCEEVFSLPIPRPLPCELAAVHEHEPRG